MGEKSDLILILHRSMQKLRTQPDTLGKARLGKEMRRRGTQNNQNISIYRYTNVFILVTVLSVCCQRQKASGICPRKESFDLPESMSIKFGHR